MLTIRLTHQFYEQSDSLQRDASRVSPISHLIEPRSARLFAQAMLRIPDGDCFAA